MVALQRFLLALSGLLISALAVELALEFAHERDWERKRQSTKPFYSWSFNTSNGQSLGGSRGSLKLMVHPLVGYTNLPNQKTASRHRGVPLLDLNAHADRIESNMFMDKVHLDARGNQTMAAIVAPILFRPAAR